VGKYNCGACPRGGDRRGVIAATYGIVEGLLQIRTQAVSKLLSMLRHSDAAATVGFRKGRRSRGDRQKAGD
jgi:hypothetical protein